MKGNVVETRPGIVWVKHSWLCKRFMEGGIITNDLFFAKPNNEGYICMTKIKLDQMEAAKATYEQRTRLLNQTAELNNKGLAKEKAGDIKGAIQTYEKCITLGYDAYHAYDRLMILYRKLKDFDNEERVILKAIAIFSDSFHLKKYRDRLGKVRNFKEKHNSKAHASKSKVSTSNVSDISDDSDCYYPESF